MIGSKASTYAILAVIEIARHEQAAEGNGHGCMRASSIASHFKLPAAYAAKVMTQLVRAGVLQSDRGPRGGFRLARPANTISVLEIVEAVDGPLSADPGLDANVEAQQSLVGVNALMAKIVGAVRGTLSDHSVAGFLQPAYEARVPTAHSQV